MPSRLRRSAALALAGMALVASGAPAAAAPDNKNSLDIAVECEGGSSFILVTIEFNAASAGQLVGADGARVGHIVAAWDSAGNVFYATPGFDKNDHDLLSCWFTNHGELVYAAIDARPGG